MSPPCDTPVRVATKLDSVFVGKESSSTRTQGLSRPMSSSAPVSLRTPPTDLAYIILGFLDWSERGMTASLNQYWANTVFGSDYCWQLLAQRLRVENHVYVSPVCLGVTWRSFFIDHLWPMRRRWLSHDIDTQDTSKSLPNKFAISVVARFRARGGDPSLNEGRVTVHLPLHQRLDLVKRKYGCSAQEARTKLFGVSNGFFNDAHVSTLTDARQEGTRAMDSTVETAHTQVAAEAGVVALNTQQVVVCAPGVGMREFACFDAIHGERATQRQLYEDTGRKQVSEFINGLNCTILCYGQTGSGKTFTLFGPDAETSSSLAVTELSGIVPRACAEVLDAVAQRRNDGIECRLQASYVEIFGDQVLDLLNGSSNVGHWSGMAARALLDGEARVTVNGREDLESLLRRGDSEKRRAATSMNERSSRAHTVLFLTLHQSIGGLSSVSTLCLADLGGCEQTKKSGAAGEQLREAININSGLLALKQCITALNDGASHVPYHDSKLTTILSPALGGDSKTTIVVTGSLDPIHAHETMQALRFGERCAKVENQARKQASSVNGLIAALDAEIAECREEIQLKERWENRQVQVIDEFDGPQTVTQSFPVGADAEHAKLEGLMARRLELLGTDGPSSDSVAEPPKKKGKGSI